MEDLKETDTDVGVEWMKTVEGGGTMMRGINGATITTSYHHLRLQGGQLLDAVFVNYDDDGDGMTQK